MLCVRGSWCVITLCSSVRVLIGRVVYRAYIDLSRSRRGASTKIRCTTRRRYRQINSSKLIVATQPRSRNAYLEDGLARHQTLQYRSKGRLLIGSLCSLVCQIPPYCRLRYLLWVVAGYFSDVPIKQ